MERSREKHKRGANYTEQEKTLFLEIIKQYSNIIDNRKTDSETVRQKKVAWKAITLLFNQIAKTGPRDGEQLRYLYDNIKRKKKKSIPEENNAKPVQDIQYIEFIKEETLPDEDEIMSIEEQMVSTDERTSSVDEQVMTNEEQVLPTEDQIIFTEEQIIPTEVEPTPIEEQIMSNKDPILPTKEQSSSDKEKVTSTSAKAEDILSMKYPELCFSTRFNYLQRRRRLFKGSMSSENLKMIYLNKKIQNANLKRRILIAEHKMQMRIFKAHLRRLKE